MTDARHKEEEDFSFSFAALPDDFPNNVHLDLSSSA
jgi:hypothetical protein